jgi:hypothetical protein
MVFVAACALLALGLVPAAAQTRLFPGASVQGSISSDTPSVEYSFDALAGDRIRARVLGIRGLDASLGIADLGGNLLAGGNADPWSPDPTDGFVAVTIPADGPYTVLVGSEAGTTGEYLLQFEQDSAVTPLTLGFGETTTVPVLMEGGSLWLDFEASPDCATTLVASPQVDPSAGYFGYLINVFDESGAQVGQINGERPVENRLTFAEGSGRYFAQIQPWKSERDGQLLVSLSCGVEAPACMETAISIPDDAPIGELPPGLFSARAGGELTYGDALQGDVGQGPSFRLYQFNVTEGDELAVQVSGVSFGFNPVVYLIAPSQEVVGLASDSPGAFKANDAVPALIAAESGPYQAYVGSEDEQAGAFLIRLVGAAATPPIDLPFQEPVVVAPEQLESIEKPLLRYTFEAQPNCATMVTLEGDGAAALSLGSYVRRAQGDPVGRLRVSDVTAAALVVPADSGGYEVLLAPPDEFSAIEPLTLTVTCQLESSICEAVAGNALLTAVELPPFTPVPTREPVCGNSICDGGWENEFSCPGDCDICGNGVCGPFESFDSCQIDCPFRPTPEPTVPVSTPVPEGTKVPICGDGWCEADEAIFCCGDCGTCPTQPTPDICVVDGVCDWNGGENELNCPRDCMPG